MVRRPGLVAVAAVAAGLLLGGATATAALGGKQSAGAPVASADNTFARLALADVHATVAEIVRIEDGYEVGKSHYQRAAHRALNALVGRGDRDYLASAGDPGDAVGAIGHIDRLLDRNGAATWTPALEGAKVNLLAAAQSLSDALHEKEMENYQSDLTQALADISLAIGRSADSGVLGGLEGALSTTTLGVPAGMPVVSGCGAPARAPAYGVVGGRLAYIALPTRSDVTALPREVAFNAIAVAGDRVVLYTAARNEIGTLCRAAAAGGGRELRHEHLLRRTAAKSGGGGSSSGALYTEAQARAGQQVFAKNCVSCHGANLQGTAAPAVAGTAFLKNAEHDRWTIGNLRDIIFDNMPLNNPGSLSPKQYADVTAFILASNCYPAGKTPFPTGADPKLSKVKVQVQHGAKPTNAKLGTCSVK